MLNNNNMEIFKIDLFKNIMDNLIGRRVEQLEKQEILDKKLHELKHKCPQTLVDFLFFQRQINRQNTQNLHETNFFDIYTTLNKNINSIDKFDEKITIALNSDDPCKNIALLCKS